MTTATKPKAAKPEPVTLESLEADLREMASDIPTPPTSREQLRLASNVREVEVLNAELRDFDNRRQLITEIYNNALAAIETNRADIIATIALCPIGPRETEVPGSNVTVLRQGAAE